MNAGLQSSIVFVGMLLSLNAYAGDTLTNVNRKFFQSIGITVFAEAFYTPAIKDTSLQGSQSNPDTNFIFRADNAVTLIGVTYDARWNLYDYEDIGSVSVSVPVAFSLNFYEYEGMCTMVLPVFLDANYGMHSTYNNIDSWGGHIGFGYQLVTGPMFKRHDFDIETTPYFQPVARIGVKGPMGRKKSEYKRKGKNPDGGRKNMYADFYWGFGKIYENEFANGFVPEIGYRKTPSKFYCKLAIGWLINYE
jgi:hypothetical protein